MSKTIESQNIALVLSLCAVWEAPDYTAEMIIPFLSEDCSVRFVHTLPYAHGKAAVLEQARQLMPTGKERMKVRTLSVQATGPAMVTAHRIDTLVIPGQADTDWEMFGVFLIENGTIREWTDYMLTPFEIAQDGTILPS